MVTDLFARRATLARLVRLLSAFRFEQSDPARFFTAPRRRHTAAMVGDLWPGDHHGRTVRRRRRPWLLRDSVHRGRVGTTSASNRIPARCMRRRPRRLRRSWRVRPGASGLALPFADGSVDVCLSSNVAEHVARPWRLGEEMLRVTRPGGLAILSYTVGWGRSAATRPGCGTTSVAPGGRALHPAETAIRRRITTDRRCSGCRRPTVFGGRSPPARSSPHSPLPPAMGWWMTSVPGLREFLVSNLVLVLSPSMTQVLVAADRR